MEKSIDKGPPLSRFLSRCLDMVDDPNTDKIISWSPTNDGFIIWDMNEFSHVLLPKYFKHSNYASFLRQLNAYDFKRSDSVHLEFVHNRFIKGQKHLLKSIIRKRHPQGLVQQKQSQQMNTSVGASVEVGRSGLWEEVEDLKRDKNALMQELVNLRRNQETVDGKLLCLGQRLQGIEKNQQKMLSFLVMAMRGPGRLAQLLQPTENNWCMTKDDKKRRLPMLEQSTEDGEPVPSDGHVVKHQQVVNETSKSPLMPMSNTNVSPEFDPSPGGDFFIGIDFTFLPMEEDLLSSENDSPLVFPDLPDDGLLEQLLQASSFLDNNKDTESETASNKLDK